LRHSRFDDPTLPPEPVAPEFVLVEPPLPMFPDPPLFEPPLPEPPVPEHFN